MMIWRYSNDLYWGTNISQYY